MYIYTSIPMSISLFIYLYIYYLYLYLHVYRYLYLCLSNCRYLLRTKLYFQGQRGYTIAKNSEPYARGRSVHGKASDRRFSLKRSPPPFV